MRRCFVVLVALLAAVASFVAPPASAEGTPIGNLGDTLRVEFKGIVADVTVHDVIPTDPPPGYRATGSPRWINEGGPWKALVTVHTIQAPTPYAMAIGVRLRRRHSVRRRLRAQEHRCTGRPAVRASERPAGGDRQRRRVLAGLPRPRDERGAGQPGHRPAPGAVEHLAAGSTATVEPWPLTSPRPSRPICPNSPTSPPAPFRWPVPRR